MILLFGDDVVVVIIMLVITVDVLVVEFVGDCVSWISEFHYNSSVSRKLGFWGNGLYNDIWSLWFVVIGGGVFMINCLVVLL